MCGIAALFALNDGFRPINQIVDMASLLRHRGPDDESFAFFGEKPGECVLFGGEDTPQSVYGYLLPYTPKEPYTGATGFKPRVAFGHRRLAFTDQLPSNHQQMCEGDRRFWIICDGEIYNRRELRNELEYLGHNFTSESDAGVILRSYIE